MKRFPHISYIILSLACIALLSFQGITQPYDPEKVNKAAVPFFNQAMEKAENGKGSEAVPLIKKALEKALEVPGIIQQEINHQQYKGYNKKQNDRDDHFYQDGNPDRLVIERGLQIKDQYRGHDKTDDTKSE